MKNKGKIAALLAAVLCASSIIPAAACAYVDEDDGHEFTVLTIKEETVKDYNTMPVFRALARETGRDVYWTYNTSMQYSNNSNPVGIKGIDAIYHAGFSNLQLYNYGRRGKIAAIDEYIDRYMPNFKAILEKRPDIKEAIKSPDGHIYSLPRVEEMGLKPYPNLLFINKTWIKELIDGGDASVSGLEESDLVDGLKLTRAQYKSILLAFKKKHSGCVPLAFVHDNWQGNESDFIASFGVPENMEHKTIVNDEVVFTVENPNWFKGVKAMQEWYSAELISSSAFTQTQDEFLARGQDGRYASFYWWEKDTVVSKNRRDDYIVLQPLVDDETGKQYVGLSNELEIEKSECVILSSCRDKAGLLSYFDKFFEPDYSAQLNYGSIDSGAFQRQKVDGKLIPNDNHGKQSADDFRMKNAPYGVVYLTQEEWNNNIEMESRAKLRLERLEEYVKPYNEFADYKSLAAEFSGEELEEKLQGRTVVKSIPNLNYTKEELDTLNRYETMLGKNINSWMVNRIISGKTISESDWRSNLINANKTAMDNVKRVNQDAYNRYLNAIK